MSVGITRRTTALVAATSASWGAIATDSDVSVAAVAGDVLQVGVSILSPNAAMYTFLDAATMVSGSPVNWVSTGTSTHDDGVFGWFNSVAVALQTGRVGGSVPYTVKPDDVVNGVVTFRFYAKNAGGTANYTVNSSNPAMFYAFGTESAVQVEAVAAQVLAGGTPKAQVEAVAAQALVGGTPKVQVEAEALQVLFSMPDYVARDTPTIDAETGKLGWWRNDELTPGMGGTAWPSAMGDGNDVAYTASISVGRNVTPTGGPCIWMPTAIAYLPNFWAQASSVQNNDTASANKGLSGGSASWLSAATPSVGTPVTFKFRPKTPITATSLTITPHPTEYSVRAPKDFLIQGSDDGTSWTTLSTVTGATWPTNAAQTFNFSNSHQYAWYRISVSACVTATQPRWSNVTVNGTQPNPRNHEGELWVVVKSRTANGAVWKFGTSGQSDHYPFSGTVYDDFASATRNSFAVGDINNWRIHRIKMDAAGVWRGYYDSLLMLTTAAQTKSWILDPSFANGADHLIAEMIVLDHVLSDATADLFHRELFAKHIDSPFSAYAKARKPKFFLKADEFASPFRDHGARNNAYALTGGGALGFHQAASSVEVPDTFSVSGFSTTTFVSPAVTSNTVAPTTAYTLMAAVKTTGSALATIFSAMSASQYTLKMTAAGKLQLTHYLTGGVTTVVCTGATSINDGQWHLVAARWNGSSIQVFVDGVADASAVAAASVGANSGPAPYIGLSRTGASTYVDPWQGSLSVPIAWADSDSLTDTDIATLYDLWSPAPAALANMSLGADAVDAMYVGSSEVTKVYRGDTLVFG